MVENAANPSPAKVSAGFLRQPEKASHRTPHRPPIYIANPAGEIATTQDHGNDDQATTGDDGIGLEAIDTMAALWAAVGCRSNWTTPTKAERLRRARDAQQRAIDRHARRPAKTAPATCMEAEVLTRERDEYIHDVSAWND